MAKDWIAGATPNKTKGVFRREAERHGMSTASYARAKQNASGTEGKRARLALTLMGMHKGKK